MAKGKRTTNIVDKSSSMKWGRRWGDDEVHRMHEDRSSAISFRAAVDKVMSKKMFKSFSIGDAAFGESDTTVECSSEQERAEAVSAPVPEHIRLLGLSAYQAMIDAEKEGYMCIVEKSYVLTGIKLQDTSLFFCALQNLIDMERKVRDTADIFLVFFSVVSVFIFFNVLHFKSDS